MVKGETDEYCLVQLNKEDDRTLIDSETVFFLENFRGRNTEQTIKSIKETTKVLMANGMSRKKANKWVQRNRKVNNELMQKQKRRGEMSREDVRQFEKQVHAAKQEDLKNWKKTESYIEESFDSPNTRCC